MTIQTRREVGAFSGPVVQVEALPQVQLGDGEPAQLRGARADKAVIYVNGALVDSDSAVQDAGQLARASGRSVKLIYNASEGPLRDALQSITDRLDPLMLLHKNRAVQSATLEMIEAAKRGTPTDLVGHSEGSTVLFNASLLAFIQLALQAFDARLSQGESLFSAARSAFDEARGQMRNLHVVSVSPLPKGLSFLREDKAEWAPPDFTHRLSRVFRPIDFSSTASLLEP